MKKKYHLYLGTDEHDLVMASLLLLKNKLTAEGKFTDAIDDAYIKVVNAPKRKVKIK